MSLTTLLFSFSGRASRKHFWLFLIAYFVVLGIAIGIDSATVLAAINAESDDVALPWITTVAVILSIWPALAVQVKRWHDRNKSGWWILIHFVPVIGPLWSFVETGFLAGTPAENRYGAPVA